MKKQIKALLAGLVVAGTFSQIGVTAAGAASKETSILGKSSLGASHLAKYVDEKNKGKKGILSSKKLANLYLKEGAVEGVRGDIAFLLAASFTNNFNFNGNVKSTTNNFGGIYKTEKTPYTFKTVEEGVKAHIQHLKAYSTAAALKGAVVDPKYKYVKKGSATTFEDLNGTWYSKSSSYVPSSLSSYTEITSKLATKPYVKPSSPVAYKYDKKIMGKSQATVEQMVAYTLKRNASPKLTTSLSNVASYYLIAGAMEGVRGDVAYTQALKETGYFKFGNDVKYTQNNFSGIGAVGGGAAGNTFKTAEEGVYAQIQHLKAYASKEGLKSKLVDPRFKYVTRGVAPTWQQLHGRWAMQPTGNYGEEILQMHKNMVTNK